MAQSLLRNLFRPQNTSITQLFLKPIKMTATIRHLQLPKNVTAPKSIYKTEEAKKIRFYVLHRYLQYLKNYDKVLERSFPGAMRVYRVFSVGIKDFMVDLKEYVRIVRLMSTKNLKTLTRKEIELYHRMPNEMKKVAPVLLLSALPFANYVVFPLAYLFPRQLLCSHFWNIEQKAEFKILNLRNRLWYNRSVFRCVQGELDFLKERDSFNLWRDLLGMIGSGVQPSVEQIQKCRGLFMAEPYHLFYLRRRHVKYLLKIHDLHTGWFRKARLAERALILKAMDDAITREGGVHNMPPDALKNACFIRGLNPTNMRNEELVIWMKKWIAISQLVDRENLSLLLHCPILLAYNEPSNWALIYTPK